MVVLTNVEVCGGAKITATKRGDLFYLSVTMVVLNAQTN